MDSQIAFGNEGKLIAEYARSSMDAETASAIAAEAYQIKAVGNFSPEVSAKAYWRTVDPGFTNEATVSFVPGQTSYGGSLEAQLGKDTHLRTRYDHEENFGSAPIVINDLQQLLENPAQQSDPVDNHLTTIAVGVLQALGDSQLSLDWIQRDREDAINDLDSNSQQLRSRLNVPLSDSVTAYALNETTLSAQTDAIFSDQTAFGLGWTITPRVELGLSQQWFTNGQFAGQSLLRADLGGNHALSEDTTLIGRYSVAEGINGTTSQAALGLNHQWTIFPNVNLDLGYERVFGGDFFGKTATGKQFPQPFAVGQTASSLGFSEGESYHLGLKYQHSDWQAKARFEHRSNENGENTVITSKVTGELTEELSALAHYHQASASNQKLSDLADTINLRLGLAYRDPDHDQWNALFKYEYRQNPAVLPNSILAASSSGATDHLFSTEVIYAPNWQWEFHGKYAFRESTTFLAEDFESNNHLSLVQLRATHRFAQRWEITGEGRWIEQHSVDVKELGILLELGYYLTPDLRLSGGYSWGEVSDRDFGRDRAAEGLYFNFTYKVHELFKG